jgi:hypothetical protein
MNRRVFLIAVIAPVGLVKEAVAANQKFVFKIKTKSGGIIGNISIEAKDIFAAISKLNKRYSGCEILEAKKK